MNKRPAGSYLLIWILTCLVSAIPALCSGSPAGSGSSPSQPYLAMAKPYWAENGRITLGLQVTYGLEGSIPHNISHINVVFAEPQIGMIIWNSPHTRLPIERAEVLSEGIFGGSAHPGGELFGASLLFRLGLKPVGNIVPYFDAGSGPVHTSINAKAPELTGDTQFLSEGGFGLQYFFKPQHALTVEYSYFHMSNAGMQQPNPGFNGSMVTIGFCWMRGPHLSGIASVEHQLHLPHFWH